MFSKIHSLYVSIGLIGILRLAFGYFISVLYFKKFVLLRWPFYIRNKSGICFGADVRIGHGAVLECFNKKARICFGNNVRAYNRLHVGSNHLVTIGSNVLIASDVYISDHSHGVYTGVVHSCPSTLVNIRPLHTEDVYIGDDVWIGDKVCVLPGVQIGANSIIGANSVVTNDIPENSIAAGVPAKVIKKWDGVIKSWLRV